MLHYAKLDKCFWAEAAMTAIYIKNRLPSPKYQDQTPFKIVNGFVEKTAAVKKTPRQAASSVEASGRPSFAIPVGTGMYQ
uniref:Uncharacterized protein n=1 Tax=Peronospora matthiolae TaxID=2874970 RepID=A0AAV1TS89_9STRA